MAYGHHPAATIKIARGGEIDADARVHPQ